MQLLRAYIVSLSVLVSILGLYTALVLTSKRTADNSLHAAAWTEQTDQSSTAAP